jgi:hypothetical protein
MELQCKCGLNELGYSFCPKVFASNYTETIKQVATTIGDKKSLHKCHTLDRLNIYECLILNVASIEELDLLDRYIMLQFESEKSNEVRENPLCVTKHSRVSQYWEAMSGRTLNRDLHNMMTVKSAQMMQSHSFHVLAAFLLCIIYFSFRL